MVLLHIFLATLAGGVLSVLLAATLALTWLARFADRMVAYAVGVLLAFAFTSMLPEAVALGLDAILVGQILLAAIVVFFLLEKAALWRHDHNHAHGQRTHPPQVAMIVLGDGLHNFVDGVLIAAAFLVDPTLGWITTMAVLAHELPQEIGDFMVLLNAGLSKSRALALNALSGAAMILGGVAGYFALDGMQAAVPYVLVVAAASFIYIAVADLVPELHRHRRFGDAAAQLLLLLAGIGTVQLIGLLLPHTH
ncbi:MAG: ZIP family metal transporter [Chromatiaceae bacterium]|jgi:zinc and cadmium transporter|nr:ZIP family metal transporter [Chromatiaceae bacterium]